MDQASEDGISTQCGEFARICVFCGSSSGKKAIYTEVAEELGTELVRRGINLVYGGGSIGLMGTVAKATQAAGGHVVGVIPKALMPKEICGNTVGELVAVDNMHQRKAEMAHRADAFIALPGGFGTFEEVLEVITWAQLGIHKKPVGLLNVDGYHDALLRLFDKALDEGFLNLASHNIVVSASTAAELLDKLKNYTPTVDESVPKLTWDSIEDSASQKGTVPADSSTDMKGFAPTLDSGFHSWQGRSDISVSRSSGARASTTAAGTQRIGNLYRLATSDGVYHTFSGSGNILLLPQLSLTSAMPRAGRFSMRTRTLSSVGHFRASGRSNDRSAGGRTAVVGRVVMPLIL